MHDIAALQDLREWKDSWERRYKHETQSHYLFSPEYEHLWEKVWAVYDALEVKRIASSEARFPWQERVENYRSQIDKSRKQQYQPVGPEFCAFYPLSTQYSKVFRNDCQDRRLHWRSTYDTWLNFRESFKGAEIGSDGSFQSPFRDKLSPIQRSAYTVLEEWWTAKYCSAELLDAVRSFLTRNRDLEKSFPDPESKKTSKAVMTEQSYYHQVCFRLFVLEFNPRSWEPNTGWLSLKRLSHARFNAGCLATAQLVSCNTWFADQSRKGSIYPDIVSFGNMSTGEETWTEKPRWLWSVDLTETLYVPSLPSCPSYTCISHTWGRWRKSTSVQVTGVREWLVPENELYDVRRLPQKLSRLPFKYIWLDLFCIPQDDSARADEEIARQTSIFRNSESCIAWMHDVESWDDVQHGIQWLSLQYLRIADKSTASRIPDEMLQEFTKISLEYPPSLLLHRTTSRYQYWEPTTWFSSLWTLQEAILCPRIELYSKDWYRLEDNLGSAIPLVSLVVFLYVAFQNNGSIQDIFNFDTNLMNLIGFQENVESIPKFNEVSVPTSVWRLCELGVIARLYNVLLVSSPVSIIFNANIRRCTGDRAPAIMSAIGVTKWYRDRLNIGRSRQEPVEDLVLGIYPLDFVEEAFERSGACFFETAFTISQARLAQVLRMRKAVGSMLPFSAAKGWLLGKFGPPEMSRTGLVDHPAVKQWVIRKTGTVEIKLAGIFCSTQCTETHQFTGSLLWFEEQLDVEDGLTDDFHGKLRELAGARTVHAVVLYQDGLIQHGILLCQREKASDNGPLCYVRIGMYWIELQSVNPNMVPDSLVNWFVL